MRVARLAVFAVIAFVVTAIVRFPAAPVLDRLRPQLEPVALLGVEGPLVAGRVASVRSMDDLLPLEFSDVTWSLSPLSLLRGTAADVTFQGYGGGGEAEVLRTWGGDLVVDDLSFTAEAKALEPLLPVPIASFAGTLVADIARVVLEEQVLATFEGTLRWTDALLETPLRASFGTVDIEVVKTDGTTHEVTIAATEGDVAIDGAVTLTLEGDFVADVVLIPTGTASPDLRATIERMARPESDGRFRLQQSGNVNRLM